MKVVEEHFGDRHQNKTQIQKRAMPTCRAVGMFSPWAQCSLGTIATGLPCFCSSESQAPSEKDVASGKDPLCFMV